MQKRLMPALRSAMVSSSSLTGHEESVVVIVGGIFIHVGKYPVRTAPPELAPVIEPYAGMSSGQERHLVAR